MKILRLIFIFFVISSFFSSKCRKNNEDSPRYIKLINNSENGFQYAFSFAYPDMTMNSVNRPSDGNYIKPNTKDVIGSTSFFNYNEHLIVFLIDKDTFNIYAWESIKLKNNFTKRFVITESELKDLNWTLTYP